MHGGSAFEDPLLCEEGTAPIGCGFSEMDGAHVSMNLESNVRYWTQLFGCSEDELAAAVATVGNSPDAV